jgi:hypothetical protein
LKSTWALCDKLLGIEKKGGPTASSRLTPQELTLLKDPAMMELVREFRSFNVSIGPVPRAVLSTMDLRLLNITEVAHATNAFVARHAKVPYAVTESPISLQELVRQAMGISPTGFWRNLSATGKLVMEPAFNERAKISYEQTLTDFVKTYKTLPKFEYEVIDSNTKDVVDGMSGKLAEELVEHLQTGDLDVRLLDREVIEQLNQSEILAGLTLKTVQSIRDLNQDLQLNVGEYVQRLVAEGLLTYDGLSKAGDFRILQVIKTLAETDKSPGNPARQYKQAIEDAIKEIK